MAKFEQNPITYDQVLKEPMSFGVGLKVLPTKGNLVYEYNPFRNYRLSETSYLYKNKLLKPRELWIELGKITEDSTMTDKECLDIIKKLESWSEVVPTSEEDPVLVEAGELTDFETDELSFDLNHPVQILPQYSYDNSVNLIINDGKNVPRLINSRFSATARNKYQIVDRKGNNDTNIYDQGSQFDIDTSLYKRITEIPRLRFIGTSGGGRLPIGNYHFYFRYADADGNETDFIAESGLVSVFIGSSPSSIRSGFRDEDSHKSVRFLLTNIDSSYQYVNVYYTRSTSDIDQNAVVQAVKIEQKYLVNNALNCNIIVTGYEDTIEIPVTDINPMYQMADSVETQTSCQNMLFLGNIHKPEIPYKELEDLSLRFLPYIQTEDYPLQINSDYNVSSTSQGYYDTKFIYNKVGYWNHELYRLGIVYILSDNSLSPVFNIRGIEELSKDLDVYSDIPMWQDDKKTIRNFIVTEEDTYKIVTDSQSYPDGVFGKDDKKTTRNLENSKGVISIGLTKDDLSDTHQIYSIGISVPKEVTDYLKEKLNIKGLFFVRQKRIPTILCQAYTIGIDNESKTPILPTGPDIYIAERFVNNDRILTHDFDSRVYEFKNKGKVRIEGAICPEYDVDSPYLNSLFTGDRFAACESDLQPSNNYLTSDGARNYYISMNGYRRKTSESRYNVRVIGVEDNTKLVAIGNKMFSARAGEAEEAFRYEYLERENKITKASNLVRGSYGPYLGITGYNYSGKMLDIKIPGFNELSDEELFKIRYNDKSQFFSISERIALKSLDDYFIQNKEDMKLQNSLFRGDCYICQFTHRVNRNFQDPSAPINDKIVDPKCWADNFEVSDDVVKKENFEKINLGDVNAIKLGMWVTFTVRSTKNLNIRNVNDSMPDETALTGHDRTFYPYGPLSPDGAYKVPEALCYNKGFEKSLSERWNYDVPDVPALKNDFTNRISYSDVHVNDAFKNGFRVFQGTHYRDYPKTYGSITKLIELRGNLLCVFEHGVALIPVNERAIAGEGSGGNIYINTSNVLPENPKVISDTFGSQWKESIIKTPRGIYGVDTVGKKIWRTNGEEFECISDFRIQEFLNNNISLTERELDPVIGIRNVKAHYNRFKGDVMFTFYDNLYGFEEKVWNICFSETLQKWITFYSWVPSYSENIYNQYFSFDRNTSKWIAKLGVSKAGNDFSDGVVLTKNIIPNDAKGGLENNPGDNYMEYEIPNTNYDKEKPESDENPRKLKRYGYIIGSLDLANRTLPSGDEIEIVKDYELVPDNFGNWKNFGIDKNLLYLKTDAVNLCSEFFVRGTKSGSNYTPIITDPQTQKEDWIKNCILNSNYTVCKDDRGRRINLDVSPNDKRVNAAQPVILLNVRCNIKVKYTGTEPTLGEAYASGITNGTIVDAGYYQSVVAVTTKYNMQFLTTDFWKHGQAGIIDIADKIYPTYWYGKQHPFEFEFVVADNPQLHKIFDDLEIISNKAAPESFHYEIVGQCYDFSKDKKNMYIRQEATKDLYQKNGFDVLYDINYDTLKSEHRALLDNNGQKVGDMFDKSTLFPLYYSRRDSFNEIEDFYHMKDNIPSKDFSALSGGEIVRYGNLDEYRIWNHAKAVDLQDSGRMRGNMQYKEDKWNVQINPLNIVQKNEPEWKDLDNNNTSKVPVELGQSPIPNEVLVDANGNPKQGLEIPDSFHKTETNEGRGYTVWKWNESQISEVKLKDKFIKIRIRYSGKDLAIISAIKTLYSASYS